MGMAFAFGWTPCIGPALAAVLTLAGQGHTLSRGIAMLLAYSLGLGVPFVARDRVLGCEFANWSRRRTHEGTGCGITQPVPAGLQTSWTIGRPSSTMARGRPTVSR